MEALKSELKVLKSEFEAPAKNQRALKSELEALETELEVFCKEIQTSLP